jgi:hypothetical protein
MIRSARSLKTKALHHLLSIVLYDVIVAPKYALGFRAATLRDLHNLQITRNVRLAG